MDGKEALRKAMDELGMTDNVLRAGTAAIVGGESHFVPKWETSWANTDNSRIRRFFGSRLRNVTEGELTRLKKDPRQFFNAVYGGAWGKSNLGNTEPDDGYNLRGGGLIQLTGRDNYETIGQDIGVDLVNNPNLLVEDVEVSAKAAVAYMLRRFKGGDFDDMKKAVGVSMGEPDDEKNRLFALYMDNGEWNAGPKAVVDNEPVAQVIVDFIESLQKAERFLATQKEDPYEGPIDKDPGPGFRKSYKSYMLRKGIKV